MMPERIFISIGSNKGDSVENCLRAVDELDRSGKVTIVRKSSLYRTEPWGKADQPEFTNCAVEVTTGLPPAELLRLLKSVEALMGRTSGVHWGPRLIDLDIIFYGDRVIEEEDLTVPHPHAHERAFVLVPLAEIAGGFIHPLLGRTIDEILSDFGDTSGVARIGNG